MTLLQRTIYGVCTEYLPSIHLVSIHFTRSRKGAKRQSSKEANRQRSKEAKKKRRKEEKKKRRKEAKRQRRIITTTINSQIQL